MTTYALGRHVEHDERSRNFAFGINISDAVSLKTVDWPINTPILDQGNVGSCTGNALAQWLNTDFARRGSNKVLTEHDALQFYSAATKVDNVPGVYPPNDTGSTGLAVCKAGVKAGWLSGYKHAFGFDQLLATLQHTPVIVGTEWLKGMFTPNSDGVLKVSGVVAGGHEYLVRGVDMEKELITMTNSWAASWGKGGTAYIKFDDFRKLLAAQGDVTVPIAK